MSSTTAEGLPDEFVQRFRQLVAERLARAESLWFSLLQGTGHDAEAAELLRVVHTLKGDAGVIGLTDVHLVCHELEELLDVAKDVAWAVPDDLDLLVTMSFHFIGLLARRPAGAPVAGIDLAGFVQEVDQAVRATRALERFAGTSPRGSLAAAPEDASLDQESRLARAATLAFLEHLGARGASRERLHQLWKLLRQEVAQSSSTPLQRLVERHVGATKELGEQLGKLVDVEVEVRGLSVTRRVADALDVGLLHGIRNAIDHGLEPPHERTGAGKPPRGRIRVTAAIEGDVVEMVVEDDGRGFDHAAIVQRALDNGLVGDTERDAERGEARFDVHELVFRSGFSTAHRAGRISGRGVGLDAARAALGKVGGQVTARARDGGGARIVMRVPALVHHMQVYVFEVRPGIPVAIPATWVVTVSPEPEGAEAPGVRRPFVIDPLEALGIAAQLEHVEHVEHVLMLRRGLLHVHFGASSLPRLATAQRICPTTASDPMEVVMVQGREVLVLRPEQLAEAALLDGWRSPSRAT